MRLLALISTDQLWKKHDAELKLSAQPVNYPLSVHQCDGDVCGGFGVQRGECGAGYFQGVRFNEVKNNPSEIQLNLT